MQNGRFHVDTLRILMFGTIVTVSCLQSAAQTYVFGRADYPTGNVPSAVAAGDLNGDGILDVVVVNAVDKTISIRLGNPDSTLKPATDILAGTTPVGVLIADFNKDGKLDVAVSNFDDNTVSILLGNGDGTFQAHVDYPTDIEPRTLEATDLNGDGRLDLLVATGAGTISVLLGNGDGTFQNHVDFQAAPGAGAGQAGMLIIGDFNGDGKTDIAYPDINTDTVAVLLGNGDGTFQAFQQYPTGRGPDGVAAGDFNGDGKMDLAVSSSFENVVSVLSGNGDGIFQSRVDFTTGPNPGRVIALDLDNDGKLDLAVVNQNCNGTCQPGSVSVLLGKGNGDFQTHVDYAFGFNPSLAAADFNGDGHVDFAVVNGSDDNLQVLLGNGDGTFPGRGDVASGTDSDSIVVGDFNGDGFLDLAVGNNLIGAVTVLLGDGRGGYPTRLDSPSGGNVTTITAGDFDHDGKLDVAGTHINGNNLSVVLGNGDGTLGAPTDLPTGNTPIMIANADLNKDGHLDLIVLDQVVVGNQSLSAVSILLGNGDGTFKSHVDYSPGGNFVAVGDFNGDGNPDLVVTNGMTQGAFSVFLGKGDGTFHSAVSYSTDTSPNSVVVADFNRDGKLDLAVTSFSNPGGLSVFLGNGDGTFEPGHQFGVGPFSRSAVTGDFNGDSNIDVAVVGQNTGQVSILRGNGDGTFQPHLDYGLGQTPVSLVAGDLDGDGGFDLAVTAGDVISVMLNRPVIAVLPSKLDFGVQIIGGTTPEQTLLLSNPGSAPVNFGGASLTGPAAGDFSVTLPCAAQIPVGGNCAIPMVFKPIAAGKRMAQLVVSDNAPGSPQAATLSGKGTGPGVILSTTTLSFPLQPVAVTSAPLSVTITNSGDQPLILSDIAILGGNAEDFAQTNACGASPGTVPPGGTCTLNVTFTSLPAGGVVRSANLNISDNTLDSPQTVLLIGNVATPEVNFSPASESFPSQIVGTSSSRRAVTLSNVGNAPLLIQRILMTGPEADDFYQTNDCPIAPVSLEAGMHCTLTAVFAPTSTGAKTATITVNTNAPCCGQDILLTGAGTDFAMTAAPVSRTINAGQSAIYSLSITPGGGFNQLVQLTCSGAPKAAACSVAPSSVTPDGVNASAVTVMVSTTPRRMSLVYPAHFTPWAVGLLLFSISLLPTPGTSRRWRRTSSSLVCLGLLLLLGCGGSSLPPSEGTPAGTYTLTVSGNAGGTIRTSKVTLVVN